MALNMLGFNVLVKVKKVSETKSGIVLTTTTRKGPLEEAEVVNIGPGDYVGTDFRKIEGIEIGDTVIIDRDYTKPMKYNGDECLVILSRDIVGVDKVAKN